ncbi:MAG: hypothetical protein N2C14_32640, partial [Planctomycetales bacterium]
MAQLFRLDSCCAATCCSFVVAWAKRVHDVIQAATGCMMVSTPVPAGAQYAEADGLHEVLIYPTTVELVGGAQDGSVATPSFSVDLDALRGVLDKVVDFGWEAHGHSETETPNVWLEGSHAGHNVLLRVLAFAPGTRSL